jgi:Prokaryotic RING finger family 1
MQFPFWIYILIVAIIRIVFRSLYGSRRYRKHVFEKFRQMLYDIEAQHGGSINEWTSWVEYRFPDGIQLRATYRNRPHLKIFVPHEFAKSLYLYRLPRFLHSLLLPVLPNSARFEQIPYLASGDGVANLNQQPLFVPILEKLYRAGYTIHTNSTGMTLTKILRPDDGLEIPFLEVIRTIREFAKLLDGPVIEIPVSAIVSDSRCVYCKEEIANESEITHCLQCGTPHHRECFDLNAGCSVFGCNSKRREEVFEPTRELLHN